MNNSKTSRDSVWRIGEKDYGFCGLFAIYLKKAICYFKVVAADTGRVPFINYNWEEK